MRAHLRALEAHLAPLGYPVHLLHAEGANTAEVPPVPYLVLRSPSWASDRAPLVSDGGLDTEVRVTAAASTAEGAMVVLNRVRALLSPDDRPTRVPMQGRFVEIAWARSEVEPQIDTDLRLPNSNRHPGFGVDSYRFTSQSA